MIKWYASEQQYAQLGNLSAQNAYSHPTPSWPSGVTGSISTIAGNLLAAKMLAQLQVAISTAGSYCKLSVLFGDFEPLVSLFALMKLPDHDTYFYGLPDFGSVAVFELFSYTDNSTNTTFPSTDDLRVRFYFRNGTTGSDDNGDYQAYPLFSRGPSQTDMTWGEFQTAMYGILVGDIGDWCTQCGATNLFCAAWNSSDTALGSSRLTNSNHDRVKPAVAGVVGAIVALIVAALLFGAVMLLGGVRFHRVQRHRMRDIGRFRGGRKMASDPDVTVPKGGAVVGASVERGPESPIGPVEHERVSSWELKQTGTERPNFAPPGDGFRASFDHDDGLDPFRDGITRPDERI